MQTRKLGQSELEISVVTFGCWQAGKDSWTGVTDEDSIATMCAEMNSIGRAVPNQFPEDSVNMWKWD